VDRAHSDGAFPNGTGDTLDRPVPAVPSGEHPSDTRLKRPRRPWSRPGRLWDLAAGKDEPTLVQLHNIAKPVGMRFRADEYEHSCCWGLLEQQHSAGIPV
jgi:hypothetical protein